LSRSQQPLVPERLFVTGAKGEDGLTASGGGLLGTLIGLVTAEKTGFADAAQPASPKPVANDPLTHNQPTSECRPFAEGKPIAGKM
jgi:hypothetical protein